MVHRRVVAVCLDCGDTLVDEATELKDENDTSLGAQLIPGAGDMVRELKRRGYKLALVADGPAATFRNNLGPSGLYDLFDARAISEEIGVTKPGAGIFLHALDKLGISRADYGRVVMVGNHLARDIKGANALGLISVWLDWAPRRPKVPEDESEIPSYTIKTPLDLLTLLDDLEGNEGAQSQRPSIESRVTTGGCRALVLGVGRIPDRNPLASRRG
jgi:putative hydrolase of the HAD superfamily